jgi:GTP cyclohydrolase I
MVEALKKTPKLKIKGHESLELTEKQREKIIKNAEKYFGKFLTALRFDWENDANMADTPHRVTKAYVQELMAGNFRPRPNVTSFEDDDKELNYGGIVYQTKIKIHSLCSHHFLPFSGYAHIGYMPSESGSVIGLSKLNRLADFCARRPQTQERLTMQIHDIINHNTPNNRGVAVMIEAGHTCCSNRGIGHDSVMKTMHLTGVFIDNASIKEEFLTMVKQ